MIERRLIVRFVVHDRRSRLGARRNPAASPDAPTATPQPRTRLSAITNNVSSAYGYRAWARKVRLEWQQEE